MLILLVRYLVWYYYIYIQDCNDQKRIAVKSQSRIREAIYSWILAKISESLKRTYSSFSISMVVPP